MKKTIAVFLIFIFLFPSTSYAESNIVIKEGTEVLLKVIDKLKSGEVKKGQVVQFLVEKAIKDDKGNVLIEDQANAYGTVSISESAGMMGTAGKLAISIDKVEAFNGKEIPLRGTNSDEGTGSTGAVIAGALFVSVLAVLFRGSNAVIPPGTIIRTYVDKTTVLSGDIEENKPMQGFENNSEVDSKLNKYLQQIEAKQN